MTTGALLLLSHQFVLMLCTTACEPLKVYPTFKDCHEAQAYYVSAGRVTKCARLP